MDMYGVENIGKATYKENYKGEDIVIEPGQILKMARSKAIGFMGTLPNAGIKVDGNNQMIPASIKALKLHREEVQEMKVWVSPRNGERHASEASMLEEDAKYETTEVSANEHACHFCDFTTDSANGLLSHIGKEHIGDTSRDNNKRTLPV